MWIFSIWEALKKKKYQTLYIVQAAERRQTCNKYAFLMAMSKVEYMFFKASLKFRFFLPLNCCIYTFLYSIYSIAVMPKFCEKL